MVSLVVIAPLCVVAHFLVLIVLYHKCDGAMASVLGCGGCDIVLNYFNISLKCQWTIFGRCIVMWMWAMGAGGWNMISARIFHAIPLMLKLSSVCVWPKIRIQRDERMALNCSRYLRLHNNTISSAQCLRIRIVILLLLFAGQKHWQNISPTLAVWPFNPIAVVGFSGNFRNN